MDGGNITFQKFHFGLAWNFSLLFSPIAASIRSAFILIDVSFFFFFCVFCFSFSSLDVGDIFLFFFLFIILAAKWVKFVLLRLEKGRQLQRCVHEQPTLVCLQDSKKSILSGDKMPIKHTGKRSDVDEPNRDPMYLLRGFEVPCVFVRTKLT